MLLMIFMFLKFVLLLTLIPIRPVRVIIIVPMKNRVCIILRPRVPLGLTLWRGSLMFETLSHRVILIIGTVVSIRRVVLLMVPGTRLLSVQRRAFITSMKLKIMTVILMRSSIFMVLSRKSGLKWFLLPLTLIVTFGMMMSGRKSGGKLTCRFSSP